MLNQNFEELRGMSEYSDDLIYPLLMWYTRIAPFATYDKNAARARNCIVNMIIQYCLMRPDELPNPYWYLRYADMGNGRFLANDVNQFMIAVFCRLQELNDPDRPVSYEEHIKKIYGG